MRVANTDQGPQDGMDLDGAGSVSRCLTLTHDAIKQKSHPKIPTTPKTVSQHEGLSQAPTMEGTDTSDNTPPAGDEGSMAPAALKPEALFMGSMQRSATGAPNSDIEIQLVKQTDESYDTCQARNEGYVAQEAAKTLSTGPDQSSAVEAPDSDNKIQSENKTAVSKLTLPAGDKDSMTQTAARFEAISAGSSVDTPDFDTEIQPVKQRAPSSGKQKVRKIKVRASDLSHLSKELKEIGCGGNETDLGKDFLEMAAKRWESATNLSCSTPPQAPRISIRRLMSSSEASKENSMTSENKKVDTTKQTLKDLSSTDKERTTIRRTDLKKAIVKASSTNPAADNLRALSPKEKEDSQRLTLRMRSIGSVRDSVARSDSGRWGDEGESTAGSRRWCERSDANSAKRLAPPPPGDSPRRRGQLSCIDSKTFKTMKIRVEELGLSPLIGMSSMIQKGIDAFPGSSPQMPRERRKQPKKAPIDSIEFFSRSVERNVSDISDEDGIFSGDSEAGATEEILSSPVVTGLTISITNKR